jgi:hypothetical protein
MEAAIAKRLRQKDAASPRNDALLAVASPRAPELPGPREYVVTARARPVEP